MAACQCILTFSLNLRPNRGQLHENHIPEALLGIVRDSYRSNVRCIIKNDRFVVWRVSFRLRSMLLQPQDTNVSRNAGTY